MKRLILISVLVIAPTLSYSHESTQEELYRLSLKVSTLEEQLNTATSRVNRLERAQQEHEELLKSLLKEIHQLKGDQSSGHKRKSN